MDKATSSEPIGNHMSVTCTEQYVGRGELATSDDQIVETEVKLVNSEIVVPSSDPIEIAAVTRSQSKQESEVNDGSTVSVTLSDEMNRMLRDIDIPQLKKCKNQTVLCMICG